MTDTSLIQRRRQAILTEMGSIAAMARGKLCAKYREKVVEGRRVKVGPFYYQQAWVRGRNCTRYVPREQAEQIRAAIAGHEQFRALADEFVDVTEQMTRAGGADRKKKPAQKPPSP
jgi:hypothetical protein